MIYVLLANGFEETEAIGPVDVLRRAALPVKLVAVEENSDYLITSSHGVTIKVDMLLSELKLDDDMKAVVLPGGTPGTENLEACSGVKDVVKFCADNDRVVASICAATSIPGHLNLLSGRKATCYPGYEKDLRCSVFTGGSVTVDGNYITADGAGSALKFGEAIAAHFIGGEAARRVTETMMCRF